MTGERITEKRWEPAARAQAARVSERSREEGTGVLVWGLLLRRVPELEAAMA